MTCTNVRRMHGKVETPAKPRNGRIVIGVLLAVLLVCVAVGVALHLRNIAVDPPIDLEANQNDFVQELQDNVGSYDAQSIVLANTSKPVAQALAEKLGATLRITQDGSFATLTLPEGTTILDIAMSEDYLADLPKMSADYHARIADVTEETVQEDEWGERLPMRPQYTVSDSDYDRQSYLEYLNMQNVWSISQGAGITVAVIDTGIDTDHPEFAGRISEYSYNATEDKIVKDYILDDGSMDWSLVEDEQGHGTAVAGVIAAAMDGNGIVGIAPQVNIIVIKAECNAEGEFERVSDLVFGLYYAIERDVSVVNMSFGVEAILDPFAAPAQLALDSDIICVAAAGNNATANLTFPAAGPYVFGVGALATNSWELAEYSNYGENVDFVAPGTVYTTQMGGGYGGMNGTSFASPITAGVLALYMSQNWYTEFSTIQELLYASCYDLGDLGADWYYGYGALDVSALMLEERGTITFNMMTDELDNTQQVFIRNHTLQNMPEPDRLYAIFDGWYYDPQFTEEYNWYADEFTSDLTLYAHWVNEDDGVPFTYVILDDGTVEIRSYTGHRRFITIPDYIEGRIVSSIGEEAFKGETRLREVKLPKYLKRIRRSAFEGCSNLVSMEIPDTVTEIGDKAFYDNVRLSTLIFGQESQLVSIGSFAFSGCAKMRTFTVPSKVTTLDATAFFRNTSMIAFDVQQGNTSFTAKNGVLYNNTGSTLVCYPAGLKGTFVVPEYVRTVGDYAFACTKLNGVELSSVEMLGGYAFAYGSLKSIVIPDSVTSMGECSFTFNLNMRSAKLGRGLTDISACSFSATALTSIEIPNGIQSISKGAFSSIGTLAVVNFEQGSHLVYIGQSAFFDSGVVSVEIPASVVTIDEGAFAALFFPYLETLTFEEGSALYTIGDSAFSSQIRLTEVDLPERLSYLGDFSFSDTGLYVVDIPASVTYFGEGAFASCHSLENIFVDDQNAQYLDIDGVVYNTRKDIIVAYPAGNPRTRYTILEGVTDIGASSFYGSWNLTRVNLSSTTVTVRNNAFFDCEYVTGYGLSDVLTYIQEGAFSKNYRLLSMHMPDSLMQIGRYAFAEDWSLYSVTFNETAKLPRISFGSFAYCGLNSFRVPKNVSTMAQGAFMGCDQLTSFTFAENNKLESISAYMFDGCSNLQTITFEKGSALTSIQAHGLEGMRKLTTIDFGDAKLTNIDNFAFRFCESLTRFDIPEGVTFLGRYAFYYCTNLSEVTVPATMDFIGRFAFLGTKDLNVYFAAETLPAHLAEDWDHGTRGYYLGVTDVRTEGDWKYAKLTSGNISIVEYLGDDTDIDLTSLDFGGDIINIGGSAFAYSTVESVVLPETLQIIQAEAFYHSALQSVSIPASVTFIGREAFASTPMQSLTFALDAQLLTIEQSAFEKTEQLGSVTIPASVTTMGRAVFKSSGITSLTFAEGFAMTEIPEEAFAYTHISTVTIPNSVTLINHNAFREIKELKSVTLGSGEELMIMSNVFYQSGLETVYIPETVGYVGEYAFVALPNLTEFQVSENNPYYQAIDGLLVSKDGRKLIAVPAGRKGSLTVPEGIEVIGFGAFEDSQLSEINFLENANILSFGYRAFYNADHITEIHIPASVVSIDYYAFAMCDNLATVTFAEDNNLKGVYEGAFYGCKNLSDIMLPDSIVEISDFAFYGCRKLTDVPVSETTCLKGIYDYAFAYAGFSGDYTTPETLIDIGPYAFMGNQFTSITVPDTNYWDLIIGIGAFAECNDLVEITLPFIGESFEDNEITWFGYIFGAGGYEANAVYIPQSLKKVTITEGITFVGTGAFYSQIMSYMESSGTYVGTCGHNIAQIELPKSIKSVGKLAFADCAASFSLGTIEKIDGTNGEYTTTFSRSGIKSITFGEGVTKLSRYTFRECGNLRSIHIPKTLVDLDESVMEYVIFHAFTQCSAYITVDEDHPIYEVREKNIVRKDTGRILHTNAVGETEGYIDTEDGFRFTTDGKLIAYLGDEQVVTLPTDFLGAPYQIYRMTGVKHVIVPEGITKIDAAAFEECATLESIEISQSVTSIGNKAFHNCHKLKTVHLSENLNSIGNYAFFNCYALTEIVIPDSVQTIGSGAFSSCYNLTSVQLSNQLKKIEGLTFSNCGRLSDITLPENITYIGNNAFNNCTALKTIRIPKNVQTFQGAFAACCFDEFSIDADNPYLCEEGGVIYNADKTQIIGALEGVTEIVVPGSVIDIRVSGVQSIEKVTFEEGSMITHISQSAFSRCTSLTTVILPDSVTTINSSAFEQCSSLTSIRIPPNVTRIDGGAFNLCYNLYVVYNESELAISLGTDDYGGIATDAVLVVDKDGTKHYKVGNDGASYIDTVDGFLFKQLGEDYTLIAYIGDSTKVSLPIGFMEKRYEISSMQGVNHVVFPQGYTHVNNGAFKYCYGLKSVEIPESVTEIEGAAFYYCYNLSKVVLNAKIEMISGSTFAGCSALTEITIPESVQKIGMRAFEECTKLDTIILLSQDIVEIGKNAFSQTQYSKDPNNWENGVLKLGESVIGVDSQSENVAIKSDAVIAPDAFENCYKLKKLSLGGDYNSLLSTLSNLETLVIQKMPTHYIRQYFGYSSDCIPLTLKFIVLGKDVQMRSGAFYGITGITIYVEATEDDTRWDENFPGWNNGNKVVYGDDWINADFYGPDGTLISSEIFLTHQIIRQPYLELAEGLEESQVLVGWDIDGDGVADTIPATSTVDIVAYPVIETKASEYVIRFLDTDGVTLISKVILPYGAEIIPPEIGEKMGYTTNGWTGYTQGMTVSGNHVFVLDRAHIGSGHEYAEPIWVAPTCTEQGYYKHACTICGEWYGTDYVDALGHKHTGVESPATCVLVGSMTYTCSVCGTVEVEIIPPKGHTYESLVMVEPSCTQKGETHYKCTDCGYKVKEKTALGAHDYQKVMATELWLQMLIDYVPGMFFGYEADQMYYYECVHCGRIQTAEQTSSGLSSGVAGILSATCFHELGDWSEYIVSTCTSAGVEARHCLICEKPIEIRIGEQMGDHSKTDAVEENRVAPTCTETGSYDNVVYCTVCGEELSRETIIVDALGHDMGEWYQTIAPACTTEGENRRDCGRCNHYETATVDALGHTEAEAVEENHIDPTCTEVGGYDMVVYCSVCEAELSREHTEIAALGHTEGETVVENNVAPTCTETGSYDNVVYCTICDAELSREHIEIPENGHTPADAVEENRVAPTCTEIGGYDMVVYCAGCGVELRREHYDVEALGHSHNAVVTAPTCTEQGYTTHTCHCGDTFVDSYVDVLGHTEANDEAVAPTCTATGLTEGTHCSVCDKVLVAQEVVPATGHTYESVVTDPTCTEKGYTTHTCYCGDSYVDSEIESLGHTPSDWIVDAEAQIGVSGSKHKECTVCGETLETEVIEALTEETETETDDVGSSSSTESNVESTAPDSEIVSESEPEQETEPAKSGGCNGTISASVALLALLSCFAVAWRPRKRG